MARRQVRVKYMSPVYRSAALCGAAWLLLVIALPVWAGPPFASDDPAPTDYQHFEIYAFSNGNSSRAGQSGDVGIDFNYGATRDVQLTAVLPLSIDHESGGSTVSGVGNVELALKYRVLHQDSAGLDVAVFPRVFLPSASARVGEQHASVFLPLWLGRTWNDWSSFGGGGCAYNNGGDARNYCVVGWVVARQLSSTFQLGAEIFRQTADSVGSGDSTAIGTGLRYDVSPLLHLMAYVNTGIQNSSDTQQYSWYSAVLFTF